MSIHTLPPYDIDAYLIEVELLLDWYLPRLGVTVTDEARATFVALWREALLPAIEAPADLGAARFPFAEPDLAARARRHRARRPARFPGRGDGPGGLRSRLAVAGRPRRRAGADGGRAARPLRPQARRGRSRVSTPPDFIQLYATLAAQRASKILGIFARLDRRDGKPQYLRHIPRVWGYLQRSLAHPALAPLTTGTARTCRRRTCCSRRTRMTDLRSQLRPHAPWCLPPASASACGRSPTACRSRWCRSPASRCSIMCSIGSPPAGVERAVVNVHYLADQIERHLAGRTAPRIVISDEREQAARHRRRRGQGAAGCSATQPFFHVNSDTIWIDGVKPNLDRLAEAFDPAHDGRAAAARAGRRPASAMPGRGDFTMAADGRLTRRGERDVVPFVYAGAAILRPALFAGRAAGRVLADAAVRPRRRGGPAAWPAARRPLDACRHARRHRRGRSRDCGECQLAVLSTAALICSDSANACIARLRAR